MKNICEWDACKKVGEFKAPTQKDNNKKFRWLCKDHIKQFNSKWDYFEGMSQGQIEDFLKSDLTWHRPTQKFSSKDNFFNILWNNALSDKFNLPWGSIFLPYWIFCSVGIWRSSNNYKGKKIWSHLTKTIITACYVMLFLYFLYL